MVFEKNLVNENTKLLKSILSCCLSKKYFSLYLPSKPFLGLCIKSCKSV